MLPASRVHLPTSAEARISLKIKGLSVGAPLNSCVTGLWRSIFSARRQIAASSLYLPDFDSPIPYFVASTIPSRGTSIAEIHPLTWESCRSPRHTRTVRVYATNDLRPMRPATTQAIPVLTDVKGASHGSAPPGFGP